MIEYATSFSPLSAVEERRDIPTGTNLMTIPHLKGLGTYLKREVCTLLFLSSSGGGGREDKFTIVTSHPNPSTF
jgi:hypothetical protein